MDIQKHFCIRYFLHGVDESLAGDECANPRTRSESRTMPHTQERGPTTRTRAILPLDFLDARDSAD